ncbi:MAG: hypothetical protein ACYC3G_00595 [Minisyncoccota bacterium]
MAKFLVGSRINESKTIDPTGLDADRIQFYPIGQYAPGGLREVPESVFQEMLKYKYHWPLAGFALVPEAQMPVVGKAQLVDAIGRISYLEKKKVEPVAQEIKDIVLGDDESETTVALDDSAPMEGLVCSVCGRKGFDRRTLALHTKKMHGDGR